MCTTIGSVEQPSDAESQTCRFPEQQPHVVCISCAEFCLAIFVTASCDINGKIGRRPCASAIRGCRDLQSREHQGNFHQCPAVLSVLELRRYDRRRWKP